MHLQGIDQRALLAGCVVHFALHVGRHIDNRVCAANRERNVHRQLGAHGDFDALLGGLAKAVRGYLQLVAADVDVGDAVVAALVSDDLARGVRTRVGQHQRGIGDDSAGRVGDGSVQRSRSELAPCRTYP